MKTCKKKKENYITNTDLKNKKFVKKLSRSSIFNL